MTLSRLPVATLFTTAALAALGAAPASAGTISHQVESVFGATITTGLFTAADGETNSLDVVEAADGFVVRDSTAPLTAAGQCTAASDGAARCPAEISVYTFVLGDGDDRLVADTDAFLAVKGGPGIDVVHTGEGFDTLDGGEGDDQLDGGGGNAPGLPDTGDEVSYAERTVPVVVDLVTGIGGVAGERDVLSGIESVFGGRGNDRLTGNGEANTLSGLRGDDVLAGLGHRDVLWGNGGDDTLRGGAAHDEIYGGAGSDRIDAGSGNDRVRADEGPRDADVIDCGPGSRDVVWVDPRVDRTRNCERVVRN